MISARFASEDGSDTGKSLLVRVLGDISLEKDQVLCERISSQKAGILLAVIAMQPKIRHSRDKLVELLWPDYPLDSARNNLRQTLFILRRYLAVISQGLLTIEGDNNALWVGEGRLESDVVEFDRLLKRYSTTDCIDERRQLLEGAIDLYRGDLLPDCDYDWMYIERQRLACLYEGALSELSGLYEVQGRLTKAIGVANRLLGRNPLNESAQVSVIRLLAKTGQYDQAMRQYRTMVRMFREELGCPPSLECIESLKSIVSRPRIRLPQVNTLHLLPKRSRPRAAISAESNISSVPPELTASVSHMNRSSFRKMKSVLSVALAFVIVAVALASVARPHISAKPQTVSAEEDSTEWFADRVRQLYQLRSFGTGGHPSVAMAKERQRLAICTEVAEAAWCNWYGGNEALWTYRVGRIMDDLDSVMAFALVNEPDSARRLIGALWRYYVVKDEAIAPNRMLGWIDPASKSMTRGDGTNDPRFLTALSYRWLGRPQCLKYADDALAAYRKSRDTWGVAHASRHLALAFASMGRQSESARLYQDSLRQFASLNDRPGVAVTLLCLSYDGPHGDAMARARKDYADRAIDAYREIGNDWGLARSLSARAAALEELRDNRGALLSQAEALSVTKQLEQFGARFYYEQGEFERLRKDVPAAIRSWSKQLQLTQEWAKPIQPYLFAQEYARRGDDVRAALLLGFAHFGEMRTPPDTPDVNNIRWMMEVLNRHLGAGQVKELLASGSRLSTIESVRLALGGQLVVPQNRGASVSADNLEKIHFATKITLNNAQK